MPKAREAIAAIHVKCDVCQHSIPKYVTGATPGTLPHAECCFLRILTFGFRGENTGRKGVEII